MELNKILQIVEEEIGQKLNKDRTHANVAIKNCYIYLARKFTINSFAKIGTMIGLKHSATLLAYNRTSVMYSEDEANYRTVIDKCYKKIVRQKNETLSVELSGLSIDNSMDLDDFIKLAQRIVGDKTDVCQIVIKRRFKPNLKIE